MNTLADSSDTTLMRKAYARWAPIYDFVYDGLTASARQTAVEAAIACGNNILAANGMTPEQLAAYTSKKYGKKLCAACAMKLASAKDVPNETDAE